MRELKRRVGGQGTADRLERRELCCAEGYGGRVRDGRQVGGLAKVKVPKLRNRRVGQ